MPDGTEPVDREEMIYRRVLDRSNYFNAARSRPLSPKAFKPMQQDTDGISVTRAKYVQNDPAAGAALGDAGKSYYVIELRAGDLADASLPVSPSPLPPDDLGHAVIPAIKSINVDEARLTELMFAAAQLPYRHHGPFPGTKIPRQ